MKKVPVVLLLALFAMMGVVVQATMAKGKKAGGMKDVHWTGTIVRSDKDASTLTVRKDGATTEKIIHYDSSTKWTKQEKGKVESIEMSGVKDGDRVICVGAYDDKGEFHATRIDQRLPH